MNICFGMQVFNGDYVLAPVLDTLTRYGPVVIAEGPVDYWQKQGFTTSTDRTNAILEERKISASAIPDFVLKQKWPIKVVHGQWPEKDEQANAYAARVPDDTDFLWMVDADEVWLPGTIERTIKLLETEAWDSVAFRPWSFFGGFNHVMGGFEESFEWVRIQRWYPGARWASHRPPTVMAPDGLPWRSHNHLTADESEKRLGRFYHYSYVFASQVQAKTQYYEDRGGCIPDYFHTVWLPWVRGNDYQRSAIEEKWQGVHEWLPERRGAAFTRPFNNEHPPAIRAILDELSQRFYHELDQAGGVQP